MKARGAKYILAIDVAAEVSNNPTALWESEYWINLNTGHHYFGIQMVGHMITVHLIIGIELRCTVGA